MNRVKIALKFGADYAIPEYQPGIQKGSTFEFFDKPPTAIINALIPYVFVVAGLILLGLLIAGGYGLMTSAGNPEAMKKGQGQIVSGIVGFLIIFLAYWIVQALGIMLGFNLLSG